MFRIWIWRLMMSGTVLLKASLFILIQSCIYFSNLTWLVILTNVFMHYLLRNFSQFVLYKIKDAFWFKSEQVADGFMCTWKRTVIYSPPLKLELILYMECRNNKDEMLRISLMNNWIFQSLNDNYNIQASYQLLSIEENKIPIM